VRLSGEEAFGTSLLRIEGDVDPDDAPALEHAAWEAFGTTRTRIILDLRTCGHISSVGMAVLFSLVRWARAKEGTVIAIGPGPALLRLFRLVHLIGESGFQVFPDFDSVPQAYRIKEGYPHHETA
jgi:anti-anti-sigma factor